MIWDDLPFIKQIFTTKKSFGGFGERLPDYFIRVPNEHEPTASIEISRAIVRRLIKVEVIESKNQDHMNKYGEFIMKYELTAFGRSSLH